MFTDKDRLAREDALARNTRAEEAQARRTLVEEEESRQEERRHDRQRAMTPRGIATELVRITRKSYRDGGPLQATVSINPNWSLTPGRNAIMDQLSAVLKEKLGSSAKFTLDIKFFERIVEAEDEHDDMAFLPDGSASITFIAE